jgi:glycosyltransferase involved in cell wall biosynthesis
MGVALSQEHIRLFHLRVGMTHALAISGIFRPDQLTGGLYAFLENLLRGFAALSEDHDLTNQFRVTLFHGRTALPWRDERIAFRAVPDRLGRFAAFAWVGAVASRGFDAALFPSYFTPPVVRAARSVSVIHDLQFRHMPRFFSPIKWHWLDACHRLTLARCDAVVTISDVVRADILNEYGARWESRVRTIHNPVCLDRFDGPSGDSGFSRGRPYIMCVAMDRPQKNLHTLIRAFDQLKDRYPEHLLIMAGQLRRLRPDRHEKSADISRDMPSTEDLVSALGLQDRVVITGFISDQQLGALYRGASAFVLPSLFEGFGMPAAEALAMRAPTLVSDLPVLREVTFGGAQYVEDPKSVGELAERIAGILDHVEAARPSAELAEKIRSHYAPPTIARQYYELMIP